MLTRCASGMTIASTAGFITRCITIIVRGKYT